MTKEDLVLAFQPFMTLSAKPTPGETSTGLGLAIVKSIIQAHGGCVEAYSDGKDKGTSISIKLPYQKNETAS